jgi:hypothetical protein
MKRLGVMAGISSNEDYFFTYGKKIYRYNIGNETLTAEFSFENGRGPLQFSNINCISGFEDSICFGEYIGNHSRKPVCIYQRAKHGEWQVKYKFEQGDINHIHALIPDHFNQCVWVLTGDFEHSAAIYKATRNFEVVEPVVSGKQHFRACVAFPTQEGLLYATDTQIEKNSIRILSNIDGEWVSKKIYDINGSCIYGCEVKDYFIFSTSTEPCSKPKNKLLSWIDNKPGPGILENKSDVISYSKVTQNIEILFSKKKDFFPYRVFQFGTIMFPSGQNKHNTLFAYNVGNEKNDLSTEVFTL